MKASLANIDKIIKYIQVLYNINKVWYIFNKSNIKSVEFLFHTFRRHFKSHVLQNQCRMIQSGLLICPDFILKS